LPSKLERLRQQLEDWGYKPDEILKEQGVKKLASALKAYKGGAERPRHETYEFTEKEKEEILQEKIREILQLRRTGLVILPIGIVLMIIGIFFIYRAARSDCYS